MAGISTAPSEATETVDASGCYVLPGGVDPHCHLMTDLPRATAAAARGGTTTVLSFTNPESGESDLACFERRRGEVAAGVAKVDVGLHAMLYDPEHTSHEDLLALKRAGAAAFKVFLSYPELGIMCSTRKLYELMSSSKRLDLVVQVHCESGELIEALVDQAVAEGRRGPGAFAGTRPPEAEEEAVVRTLAIASVTGARCYLVHLSTASAVEQVRLVRKRGRPDVAAEVCLHHLLFDDRVYAGGDAGRYLVAPPLRSASHVEALWEAVLDRTIDAIGSDHCQARSPVLAELSQDGESDEYGIAGVGARLPVLLSEGLERGVAIARVVELASATPARLFGLSPRKGVLAPGADADIVVWDPSIETIFDAGTFDDGTGDSLYGGRRVRGRIRHVLLRGQVIVRDGETVDGGPPGRLVLPTRCPPSLHTHLA